ncbi:MAG: radical SAM protein [Alphaproteobacteria bacterium]|nr:MAG: radical SAM protein [Alphaproteobacteria bacterium]
MNINVAPQASNMVLLNKSFGQDGSVKFLWGMPDEVKSVESVYFTINGKPAACISTQIGCTVGCVFCETGKQKVLGNLSAGEIVRQIAAVNDDRRAADPGFKKLDTAIVAGMGEPLLNIDALKEAAYTMLEDEMVEHVTVTTSGILPAFEKLKESPFSILSISLHATDNDTRTRLIPINKKYPIEDLLATARDLRESTDMPIIMNYLMFDGVNDSDADLERLIGLLDPSLYRVKLKQWNTIDETELTSSPLERFKTFEAGLKGEGFDVSIDYSMGVELDAGCGQLRSRVREMRHARKETA